MASIDLTKLQPGKTYNVSVRALDSDGNYSGYSVVYNFTTPTTTVDGLQLTSVNSAIVTALAQNSGSVVGGALTAGGLDTNGLKYAGKAQLADIWNGTASVISQLTGSANTGAVVINSTGILGYKFATSSSGQAQFFLNTADGNAYFRGTIFAGAGLIGGWSIGASALTAGTGTNAVGMNTTGYPFYAGNTNPALAQFRVTQTGSLTATNASITGNIVATSGAFTGEVSIGAGGFLYSNAVNVVTITTAAPFFGNQIIYTTISSSDARKIPIGTYFYVSGFTNTLYNGWRKNVGYFSGGYLITDTYVPGGTPSEATTVYVSPTAYYLGNYGGNIGGFVFEENRFYGVDGVGTNYVGISPNSTYSFFAGATDSNGTSARFSVTPAGNLVATTASITGNITAQSGAFTGSVQVQSGGSLYAGASAGAGQRVTINSTGLFGYDANGIQMFSIPTATGASPTIARFQVLTTGIASEGSGSTNFIIGNSGSAASATANNITLNGQLGQMYSVINGIQTASSSGSGFYVDKAGNFRLAGASGTISMSNGNLSVTGNINATSGSFTGAVSIGSASGVYDIKIGHVADQNVSLSIASGTGSAIGYSPYGLNGIYGSSQFYLIPGYFGFYGGPAYLSIFNTKTINPSSASNFTENSGAIKLSSVYSTGASALSSNVITSDYYSVSLGPVTYQGTTYLYQSASDTWTAGPKFAAPNLPYATSTGSIAGATNLNINTGQAITVTFPTGKFSAIPVVNVTSAGTGATYLATTIRSVSQTGLQVAIYNVGTVTASNCAVYWTATQMTSTSGSG